MLSRLGGRESKLVGRAADLAEDPAESAGEATEPARGLLRWLQGLITDQWSLLSRVEVKKAGVRKRM